MLPKFAKWYSSKLETSPLRTRIATFVGLSAMSDTLCQWMERHFLKIPRKPYDLKRTLRFATFSPFLFIPPLHYYYSYFLPRFFPISGTFTLLKRVLFDQLVIPTIILPVFLFGMPLYSGHSIKQAQFNLRTKFPLIYVRNWQFWPFVQLVNYRFIPIKFQILFGNCASIIWASYLSYIQFSLASTKQQNKEEDSKTIVST